MLKRIWHKNELLRNSTTLISGTVIAQAIPILLQPLLRRNFSAELFGTYAVYQSLIGILYTLTSGRFEMAIVLPKKLKEAANLLFLAQFINLFSNIIIFLVICIFQEQFRIVLNLEQHQAYILYLAPLGTFLYNLYTGINYILIREKQFKSASVNKVIRRCSEGAIHSITSITKINYGLLLGDIFGQLANCMSGIWLTRRKDLSLKMFSKKKIRYVARKYSEFPKYNLIPAFMSACSYLLPAVLINKFYSSEQAGYFDLSKLLLSIPLALIATSLSNVLLQRLSENFRAKLSIWKDIKYILVPILIISLIEIGIALFWSYPIFKFLFGPDWSVSAKLAKIMVWPFVLNFIAASYSCTFIAIKKIKLFSLWQTIYFSAICSLFLLGNLLFVDFIKIFVYIEISCFILFFILLGIAIFNYEKNIPNNNTHPTKNQLPIH